MSEPGAPRVVCDIRLEFSSPEEALTVQRSVELDNEGYVKARVDGSSIEAHVEAGSLKSLLHTLDDYLACLAVADNIVTKKR
jgi:tRNA threonylcarbamoyladenosine modification (KEOPS) complex  Pcc1 subunit